MLSRAITMDEMKNAASATHTLSIIAAPRRGFSKDYLNKMQRLAVARL
jgi:hypothetical protein